MTVWLGKTHPEHISIDDIAKKKVIAWKEVRHPKAMQFMSQMKIGEKMLVYHSGDEKKIVGIVEIVKKTKDPGHPQGRLIDVKFLKKFPEPNLTLADIKKSGQFKDFRLVWEPRLSVMDVPEAFLKYNNIET